jgi:hypothetical protein
MPCPCRFPAISCRVNSRMPCRNPAILRQYRVFHENPRGSRKYSNCYSYSLTDRYASDNNLRGTPCGSRKMPNMGWSLTCRLWTADANSYMPCPCTCRVHVASMSPHAALCRGLEKPLSERHGGGLARVRYGRGITCVNQTRPRCSWFRASFNIYI